MPIHNSADMLNDLDLNLTCQLTIMMHLTSWQATIIGTVIWLRGHPTVVQDITNPLTQGVTATASDSRYEYIER
jgi:hypothetical protein